jgi:antitoxin MazE
MGFARCVVREYHADIQAGEPFMASTTLRKNRPQLAKLPGSHRTGKVSRWGNSLGVRIPQEAVERLHLKDGESVHFEFAQDVITIRHAKRRRKYTEAQLLKGVTPAMCGPDLIAVPTGREII